MLKRRMALPSNNSREILANPFPNDLPHGTLYPDDICSSGRPRWLMVSWPAKPVLVNLASAFYFRRTNRDPGSQKALKTAFFSDEDETFSHLELSYLEVKNLPTKALSQVLNGYFKRQLR